MAVCEEEKGLALGSCLCRGGGWAAGGQPAFQVNLVFNLLSIPYDLEQIILSHLF